MSVSVVSYACATATVIVSAYTDAKSGHVFDAVTMPCLGVLICFAALSGALPQAAAGAAVTGGALLALHAASRGHAIGLGDVKLAVCIGALLGWHRGLQALGAAFIIGGAYAAFALTLGHAPRGKRVAFAPYMAAGYALSVAVQII